MTKYIIKMRYVLLPKALERYDVNGTKLIFTDDYETWWGPGWEFDSGLNYTKVHTIINDNQNFMELKFAVYSSLNCKS